MPEQAKRRSKHIEQQDALFKQRVGQLFKQRVEQVEQRDEKQTEQRVKQQVNRLNQRDRRTVFETSSFHEGGLLCPKSESFCDGNDRRIAESVVMIRNEARLYEQPFDYSEGDVSLNTPSRARIPLTQAPKLTRKSNFRHRDASRDQTRIPDTSQGSQAPVSEGD